jgi:hypothetical protein
MNGNKKKEGAIILQKKLDPIDLLLGEREKKEREAKNKNL